MKKLLGVFLLSTMMLSLSACQSEKAEETTAAVETAEAAENETDAIAEATKVVAPESDIEMQYITVEDASGLLEDEDYLFLDVRKAADYAESHIPGAVGADMDAAKEGDFEAGVETIKNTLDGETDENLVLICYSGKRYAQATTNVLSALGYDMSKVYTLEGGFKEWTSVYPENVEK